MTASFANGSSYPLILKAGKCTVFLARKDSQVLSFEPNETITVEIDKKNKVRFSLFLIWAGASASEESKVRIFCDATLQSTMVDDGSVITLTDNTARSGNVFYEAVALQTANVLLPVQYQIHERRRIQKKYLTLNWLLEGLPLALIGWLCLPAAFSWGLLIALLILTVIGIALPVRAAKRFQQHCSNEKADFLLHLSTEEKLHRLVFGEDDSE